MYVNIIYSHTLKEVDRNTNIVIVIVILPRDPLSRLYIYLWCIFPHVTILISDAVCYEISRPVIYMCFTK